MPFTRHEAPAILVGRGRLSGPVNARISVTPIRIGWQ